MLGNVLWLRGAGFGPYKGDASWSDTQSFWQQAELQCCLPALAVPHGVVASLSNFLPVEILSAFVNFHLVLPLKHGVAFHFIIFSMESLLLFGNLSVREKDPPVPCALQNHKMVDVGRSLWSSFGVTPQLKLRTMSRHLLNISKVGDSTTSVGNLIQGSVTLHGYTNSHHILVSDGSASVAVMNLHRKLE